jgi:superfamily II DNA or RNA helicase
MTQEEKWKKNYGEVVKYMDTNHRNPSKHRVEDHLLLNWVKHQRKLMNKGELKPERVAAFKRLLAKSESLKRVNQWGEAVAEIMKSDALRNYQQEMIDKLEEAWRQYRSVMVQMPTGTGKTVLMAEVIRRNLTPNPIPADAPTRSLSPKGEGRTENGILIVAHRRELLDQIRRTVGYFGIDMEKNHIVVESIQKLSRDLGHTENTDSSLTRIATNCHELSINPSLVIIDEAHHALAKTYRMLWERWPQAKFLGLTATPCRLNNEGFLNLFQTLIQSHTIQEFIKMGWLSDFDYVTAEPDNPILRQVAGLKKRGADGDYQTKEMAMVMDCEESIENLYQAYRKFVLGKKGIVYVIDREHARHITEYYQEHGVNCCWIEAKTPTAERDRLVQEYRDGLIDVVVNVDILGEGVDFPEVEFIQLARPTLSLSKYLQQVGRGMRIAEGKDKVVILDHVGMYQSFGLPTEDWNWRLMFTGQMAGKAGLGRESLLYVRGDGREKELIDTHMVNIKRKDEEHRGLEIFIKDGLYGIALDGRMILQPLFERVRRADDDYFAYCTYPYPVYKSRVTIIDKDGRDLRLSMYGNLEWVSESILKGLDINGKPLYWDKRYGTYYHEKPEFVSLAGIEMTRLKAGYVLRKYPELIKPTSKRDIYYNKNVVWMNEWLISKYGSIADSNYRPRRILSYGYNYFYVKTELINLPGVTIIDKMGNLINRCWNVPVGDAHNSPVWRQIPLTNAYTGEEGFPNR